MWVYLRCNEVFEMDMENVPWYKTMVVFRFGFDIIDSMKSVEVFRHKNFDELMQRIDDYINHKYRIGYMEVIEVYEGSAGRLGYLDETNFNRIRMTERQYDSRHRTAERRDNNSSSRVEITLAPNSEMDCGENPYVGHGNMDESGPENGQGPSAEGTNPPLRALISMHNRLSRLESRLACDAGQPTNHEFVYTKLLEAQSAFQSGNLPKATEALRGLSVSDVSEEMRARFDGSFGQFMSTTLGI